MKTLPLEHPDLTRSKLLALAESIPGAWLGLKIAAFLLLLAGWKPQQVVELFGLSRMGLWKWVKAANRDGLKAWQSAPRPGRKPRLSAEQQKQLTLTLEQAPSKLGWARARWDGPLVVSYVRQVFGVDLKVRQAQRWLHKLGFVLLQPTYGYVQAKKRGVARFTKQLKKNSARR
jgi:transposase